MFPLSPSYLYNFVKKAPKILRKWPEFWAESIVSNNPLSHVWLSFIECFTGRHRGGAIVFHVCGSPDPFFHEKMQQNVSSDLLLNEVSEKYAKFETKSPKFSLKFAPIFLLLSWQVKNLHPKFHPMFPIRDCKFQIKFHLQISQHTSAGMAALTQ